MARVLLAVRPSPLARALCTLFPAARGSLRLQTLLAGSSSLLLAELGRTSRPPGPEHPALITPWLFYARHFVSWSHFRPKPAPLEMNATSHLPPGSQRPHRSQVNTLHFYRDGKQSALLKEQPDVGRQRWFLALIPSCWTSATSLLSILGSFPSHRPQRQPTALENGTGMSTEVTLDTVL